MVTSIEAAVESLRQIKSKEPLVWLVPKQEFSQAVRAASKQLFSSLKLHSPQAPFDQLLIEGFDVEQILQQIDLQSMPLLSTLRREVKKFEKHPEEISKLKEAVEGGKKKKKVLEENENDNVFADDEDMDMDEDGDDDNDDDDEEEEEEKERGREEDDESEAEEKRGIEDKFLKIKELQEYLEEDEAREFGFKKNTKTEIKKDEEDSEDDEEEREENDDDNDEADELGLFDGDYEDEEDNLENARYEDFFSGKKNKGSKEKAKSRDRLEEDSRSDDEQDVDKRKGGLSTHEKDLEKLRSKIEQMEKANLDPKIWTMHGEVTAVQRQKNSTLEVDLDFEHNVRPAPVITEEVTASLEDLIKTRISEGWFDDVQKALTLSSKAPRETKELDENKSKKGLA